MSRSAFIAPVFGLALGGLFVLVWLGLERAWTGKATLVAAIIAVSAALAASAAALAAKRLAGRPLPLRFAVTFLALVVVTTGFASFALFVQALWTTPVPADSLGHMIFFIVTMAGGAVYSFLGLAAPLVFAPGLPLLVVFALLLATRPR